MFFTNIQKTKKEMLAVRKRAMKAWRRLSDEEKKGLLEFHKICEDYEFLKDIMNEENETN